MVCDSLLVMARGLVIGQFYLTGFFFHMSFIVLIDLLTISSVPRCHSSGAVHLLGLGGRGSYQ